MTFTGTGELRQLRYASILQRILEHRVLHPMHRWMQMVTRHQPWRKLGVAIGATQVHHHRAGHCATAGMTAILVNHVQRQVNAGSHTGSDINNPVFDKDTILQNLGSRRQLTQALDVIVVSGASSPSQQAGIGGQQRAGADAQS